MQKYIVFLKDVQISEPVRLGKALGIMLGFDGRKWRMLKTEYQFNDGSKCKYWRLERWRPGGSGMPEEIISFDYSCATKKALIKTLLEYGVEGLEIHESGRSL